MRHCLQAASVNRLTTAATLAVGLAPRQQHLQTVPKHDCSRRPGRVYRKICGGGEKRELHLNVLRECQLWCTNYISNNRHQELKALPKQKARGKKPFLNLVIITSETVLSTHLRQIHKSQCMCVIVGVKLARSIGNKGCTSISAHHDPKQHRSVCTPQSNTVNPENVCGEQEAASAGGEETVDIVTPVAMILNQTPRFTKALIEMNWQEGQRNTHNIFLASVKTKGLGDVATLAPAVQRQQELWGEQGVFKLSGQNNHSRIRNQSLMMEGRLHCTTKCVVGVAVAAWRNPSCWKARLNIDSSP